MKKLRKWFSERYKALQYSFAKSYKDKNYSFNLLSNELLKQTLITGSIIFVLTVLLIVFIII